MRPARGLCIRVISVRSSRKANRAHSLLPGTGRLVVLRAPLDEVAHVARPDRLADVVTLYELALDDAQQAELLLVLDALGGHREVQGVAERDQRLDQGEIGRASCTERG